MKSTLSLGKRIRVSTVVLILAFVLVWWVYDTYQQQPAPPAAPQVVPPGFVPDPAYTWVPRTRLQQPPVTITQGATPSTVTETVTVTEAPPPPFCPPFCPPTPPPEEPTPEPPTTSPAPAAPNTPITPPHPH